jgi:signal transduction histidine kinase
MRDEEVRPPESSQLRERAHLSLVPKPLGSGAERKDELSVKILAPILGYVRETFGDAGVQDIAAAAGVDPAELQRPATWISQRQLAAVLTAARAMMRSDEEFIAACSFDMKRMWGPILWVLRTTSPTRMYEIMARTMHFVSRVSRYAIVDKGKAHIHLRLTSDHPEERLVCLSRQAWLRALPELWGLPKARLTEGSCISRGDACCDYQLRWFAVTSVAPPLAGLVLGIALAWLSHTFAALRGLELITFPLLGVVMGVLFETRRTAKLNLLYGDESHNALEALGHEYSTALAEVLELHHRQQDWNHVLEERIQERQQALDGMVERVDQLQETRNTTVRSLSHDIKNPLQVVRANNRAVREYLAHEPEALDALEDNEQAIEKADAILQELLRITRNEVGAFDVRAEPIKVADIVDRVRGTLRALVMGRDIRISVFATRIAPDVVETDQFLLTRVIDNILTNAAKYTERGSIVVECDGTPKGFCLKVSDSGRGIPVDRLDKVFIAQQSDQNPVMGTSHGIGLPTVVRLLDQLGGHLEVISKANLGTTFSIHLPTKPPSHSVDGTADAAQEPLEKVLERVVKIRRVANENNA